MTSYLITGGAGFVGSHLAEALLGDGHKVTVIDDLSTGSIRNIEHLKGRSNFQYVIQSIHDGPLLAELIDGCDVVFHLAATVGVQNIILSPTQTIENNIHGTESVLRLASRKRRKIVLTSTSEVYGKSADLPFREDGDLLLGPPVKGRWSYACSKAVDEFLAIAYWREHKLPTVTVRLFNCIGPRQTGQYGMVVPRFVGQALDNLPITVYGSGEQQRCFTYIDDVVQWLILLADCRDAEGEIVNIGNTEEITILALAEKIRQLTGASSPIEFIPFEKAYEQGFEDMQRRVPDISKLIRLTGRRPKFSLEDSLKAVVAWKRGQKAKAAAGV